MAEKVIKASDLGRELVERLKADTGLVKLAALEATVWGEARAVRRTTQVGAVDQGLFRLSWNHGEIVDGAELRNDAPYASVIERGRRPGRPGPPLAPIIGWVSRKLKGEIRGQYRFAKRLALGLSKTKAQRKATREAFDTEAIGVGSAILYRAMMIQKAIHFRGTKPRWILRDTFQEMKPVFKREALRRLREKAGE